MIFFFISGAQWANNSPNSHNTPRRQSKKQVQTFLPHLLVETKCGDNEWLIPEPLRILTGGLGLKRASPPHPWRLGWRALWTIVHSISWTTVFCVSCEGTLLSAVTSPLRFFQGRKYNLFQESLFPVWECHTLTQVMKGFPYVQLIEETETLLSVLFRRS